jgi:geranylgeranyl diphosphate synthase, type II
MIRTASFNRSSSRFDLEAYLAGRRRLVEKALKRFLPVQEPGRLHQAMRYSLLAGGKRLRPILLLASAEACGLEAGKALPAACALESLHTYSLIHDDLPAMDNDDLRRGKPTCHKAFDEATAILAGDGLLTLAFEWMLSNGRVPGIGAVRACEATVILARAAGSRGMVGGQMADILFEGRRVPPATLKYIHAHKTGDLLTASLECGAALAGARPWQRRSLKSFGSHIGLAFQIADDILNVTGDEKKMGKRGGSDAKRAKATYPAVFGLEKSRRQARKELDLALKALSLFKDEARPLRELAKYSVSRES